MLGKASEIKTKFVKDEGYAGMEFDESLNRELSQLKDCEIIDIKFVSTPDIEGAAWFYALIIYKEANQ